MRKAEKGAACSWRNWSLMDSPCKDRDMEHEPFLLTLEIGKMAQVWRVEVAQR